MKNTARFYSSNHKNSKLSKFSNVGLSFVLGISIFLQMGASNIYTESTIRVGYSAVATSLPLFVAIENGYFKEQGLKIEPVKYFSANDMVDALTKGEIQATSVCADYPILTMATQSPDAFQIYGWELLDTIVPFDIILSKKGANIQSLEDLEGKTIGTFPGSQLKAYLQLILQKKMGRIPPITIIELPPEIQIPALAGGQIDALFTLEPMASMAQLEDVGQVIEASPISKYIGNGQPLPAASFALSSAFIQKNEEGAEKFTKAMWKAMQQINQHPQKYRYLYPEFTNISVELAHQIPVPQFSTIKDMDVSLFQKEADVLFAAGLLDKRIRVHEFVYNPYKDQLTKKSQYGR